MIFLIAFELHGDDESYAPLRAALNELGALAVTGSVWCFEGDDRPLHDLRRKIKSLLVELEDAVFVAKLADWASYKTRGNPAQLSCMFNLCAKNPFDR